MRAVLTTIAFITGAAGITFACSPDRIRPGPPSVTIEVREGSTVFSPDTLPFVVRASDANGLDSVVVSFLGVLEDLGAFDEVEVDGAFEWPIPAGLTTGSVLTIFARAKDLSGQTTEVESSVTVIDRP